MMDTRTRIWWTVLRVASVLNLLGWIGVLATVDFSLPYRGLHVVLAGVYTVVCGFRSFFPRVDLERTVMVDHWLSSIALGRTAATIAEMCFTLQLTLLLVEMSAEIPWLQPIGVAIVPIIAVAQGACWAGVLTGNHLWHALEEVLWTVLVVLMAVAGLGMWLHVEGMMRGLIVVGWIGCAGSAYVMSGLDVPMYVRRWRHERAAGTVFRTFGSGVADAIARREVRRSWEVWRHEVAWMTPYFTVSVWLSLFLARFSAS